MNSISHNLTFPIVAALASFVVPNEVRAVPKLFCEVELKCKIPVPGTHDCNKGDFPGVAAAVLHKDEITAHHLPPGVAAKLAIDGGVYDASFFSGQAEHETLDGWTFAAVDLTTHTSYTVIGDELIFAYVYVREFDRLHRIYHLECELER